MQTALLFLIIFLPDFLLAAEIDLNGNLTHTVEIILPPGTNGMAPCLSLGYNSGAGNGIAGQGWSLYGLPSITRDRTNEVKYDISDSYIGDSGRLIFQTKDGTYHFEYENYSRVQKYGSDDNPDYWIETKSDGTKYFYGKYDESSVKANVLALDANGNPIQNKVRIWALSKVEDIHGNYYIVEYGADNGEYYPEKIVYTMGNGLSKKRTVEFLYEGRNDYWPDYTQSARVETRNRLKEIEINVDVIEINFFDLFTIELSGSLVRKYKLEYEGGTSGIDFSRLTQIKVDDGSIDTQSFEWVIDNRNFVWRDMSQGNIDLLKNGFTGDFNGDGKTDIGYSDNTDSNMHIGYSTGNGFTWKLYKKNIEEEYKVFTGDFNGDGKTDIGYSDYINNKIHIDYSTGDGFTRLSSLRLKDLTFPDTVDPSYPWISDRENSLQTGDFNGDGRTDIAYSDYYEDKIYLAYSTGNGFTWKTFNKNKQDRDKVILGDFNGDGKTDFAYSDNEKDTIQAGYSIGTDFSWITFSKRNDRDFKIIAGDFNGDGKTDIGYSDYEDDYIYVGYSTGEGFKWDRYNRGIDKDQSLLPGDFNGDGKADIGYSDYERNQIYIGYSTGDGFSFIPYPETFKKSARFLSGDFNGDGKTDLIYERDDLRIAYSNNDNFRIKRISSVSGFSADIVYNQAAKITNAINPDDSEYPLIANSSARNLVKSITVSDGRTGLYTKEYTYTNGKLITGFPSERKNLYFESVTENDLSSGIKTITYYEQDDRWRAGAPLFVESRTAGGSLVKRDEITYSDSTATVFEGTHTNKLKSLYSTTYVSGTSAYSKRKIFTYDDYGNTTNIFDYSDGTDDVVTSIVYQVQADGISWILNRPSEVIKTSDGKIFDGKRYTYKDNKLSVISSYLDSEGTWLDTLYGSDVYGNITSVTDSLGHTTEMVYDSDYNTFVEEVANSLGHTFSMEYYAETGNLKTKKDQNGNITSYCYDSSGRLENISDDDGELMAVAYSQGSPGTDNQFIETTIPGVSGQPDSVSRSYYDGLGRVYRKETTAGNINGTVLQQVEETSFDIAGRVSSKTIPYIKDKQTPLIIGYSYNSDGMLIEEERPFDGVKTAVTAMSYSPGTGSIVVTKRDPNGNISSAKYDSRGRLVKKNEQGGAQVSYTYDGAGQLIRTVDSGNLVTSITYDSFGRKTSISDPNAGDIFYRYDNGGNLISKTDNIGNTITYTYDSINRLIKTDYPDATPDVTYNYDESSSSNGTGRVTSVDNGISLVKYAYDRNGNMEYLRQTVDNISFRFIMEYDKQNRMTSMIYPDGTEIDRVYSETGHLNAVKQGEGTYVQYALKYDDSGDVTNTVTRITGNGVKTSIVFNPATMHPVAIESRDKNNTLLENNEYNYDLNGNITKIDNLFDTVKTQEFEYDTLNRLKKAKGIYGEQNFAYSASGNLTKNSHGNMVYSDSDHPFAVTADGEGNNYTYDANGNMISGRGREMIYDAEGRMVSLKKDGSEIQKNFYDYTGHRVVQQKADGTLIYNIGGLYELVKSANCPDHHTKFIYGVDGDLASQVTRTDSTLAGANFIDGVIYDKGFCGNPFVSVFAKGYIKVNGFFLKAKNILKIQYVLVLILLAALSGALVKSGITGRLKPVSGYSQPAWSGAMSLILVISMIGSFSITGCGPSIEPPVMEEEGSAVTTDTGGIPTEGTFYFHPDHIGSVSYITDHTGGVVTRMSYTPYGEKTVTGPDIFHQKYTGQIDDGEDSELLYYNARYYDPKLGRFISADSIVPNVESTQAFNRYMYVLGNPVSFNDPSGYNTHEADGEWSDNESGGKGGKTETNTESNANPGNETNTDPDGNSNKSDLGHERGDHGGTERDNMIKDAHDYNQNQDAKGSILSDEINKAISILDDVDLNAARIKKNSCAVNSLYIELRRIDANVEDTWAEFYVNNAKKGLIDPESATADIERIARRYKVGKKNIMYNLITSFAEYKNFQGSGVVHFNGPKGQHFMNVHNDNGNKQAIDASFRSLDGIKPAANFVNALNFFSFYSLSIK